MPVLLSSMQLSAERIQEISTALRNFASADTAKKIRTNIHEGLDSTLVILATYPILSAFRPRSTKC